MREFKVGDRVETNLRSHDGYFTGTIRYLRNGFEADVERDDGVAGGGDSNTWIIVEEELDLLEPDVKTTKDLKTIIGII